MSRQSRESRMSCDSDELRSAPDREEPPPLRETHYQIAHGACWEVPKYYSKFSYISQGTFGIVCSAVDSRFKVRVAVKKLLDPFKSGTSAKRTYREIALLAALNHENIINLLDAFPSRDYSEIYLVMDLLEYDLASLIKQGNITEENIKCFTYQILRGLKYLHSADVIHRDLAPKNVAIDKDWNLKLIDFGLARCTEADMTASVATRYYRAPEVILELGYDNTIDIWSAGCILAEMILQKPLFPGKDNHHQLLLICNLIGRPLERLDEWRNEFVDYINKHYQPVNFDEKFSGWPADCVELLRSMLQLNNRPSAANLLQYSYLAEFHDANDQPDTIKIEESASPLSARSQQDWQDLVWIEMKKFQQRNPIYC